MKNSTYLKKELYKYYRTWPGISSEDDIKAEWTKQEEIIVTLPWDTQPWDTLKMQIGSDDDWIILTGLFLPVRKTDSL